MPKDDTKAAHWFQKAAEHGYLRGQHNLGVMYYNGEGVQQDYAKAVQWITKAAEQKLEEAKHNLVLVQAKGQAGTSKSVKIVKRFGQK